MIMKISSDLKLYYDYHRWLLVSFPVFPPPPYLTPPSLSAQECPCAVGAAEKLVELGVSGQEVVMFMMAGTDGQTQPPEW